MSITLGNSGDNTTQGTNTFSATSNGDYVYLCCQGTTAPTSVTYAGVAMTQKGTNQAHTAFGRKLNQWELKAPTSGANNFVMSGGANVSAAYQFFSGVDQTTPSVNPTNYNATTSTPSVSVTTTVDGAYVIGHALIQNFSSTGSGTTKIRNVSGDSNEGLYITTVAISPAGMGTLNVNTTGGETSFTALAVQPVPSAVTKSSLLLVI